MGKKKKSRELTREETYHSSFMLFLEYLPILIEELGPNNLVTIYELRTFYEMTGDEDRVSFLDEIVSYVENEYNGSIEETVILLDKADLLKQELIEND